MMWVQSCTKRKKISYILRCYIDQYLFYVWFHVLTDVNEDYFRLECNAVQSGKLSSTFLWNVLLQYIT
jgi:hypothetical protein